MWGTRFHIIYYLMGIQVLRVQNLQPSFHKESVPVPGSCDCRYLFIALVFDPLHQIWPS